MRAVLRRRLVDAEPTVASPGQTEMGSTDLPEPPPGWLSDPIMLTWERMASELELTALADVRASAKAWAAAISSLLGLFAIATYLGGAETVRALAFPWNYAAGTTIAIALLLALSASALASLAAQPAVEAVEDIDGWRLRHEHLKRAKAASLLLRFARPLGALSLGFLLVGVGLITFAPLAETQEGAPDSEEGSVGEADSSL